MWAITQRPPSVGRSRKQRAWLQARGERKSESGELQARRRERAVSGTRWHESETYLPREGRRDSVLPLPRGCQASAIVPANIFGGDPYARTTAFCRYALLRRRAARARRLGS